MRRTLRLCLTALLLAAVLLPGSAYAAPEDADMYTVRPGDTLWIISQKYQVGLSEIIAANPQFKNPHWIYPGQKVTVPLFGYAKRIEARVVELVNIERQKAGLSALKMNWELARVARYKSANMRDVRYFAHESPTYGSPFDMIKNFGISFRAAGENIAAGQSTPEEVVRSWMNSAGHRQNILNSNFTQIGVGYAEGGEYGTYWTQMFIRP